MGRVNTQTPPAEATAGTVTHFTHPHELLPIPIHNPQALCSGCRLQSSATMYACLPCNFILHQSCTILPRRITHPCHGGCTLSLLTSPTYNGGAFSCDACNRPGDGWSYHCTSCDYDLHVTCASKPMKIRHQAHASCSLDLTFKNPYPNAAGFSCDICHRIGTKQWLYRCNSCEFDAHLDCIASRTPHVLQHHHSLPAAAAAPLYHNQQSLYHNQQLAHNASMGGMNVHGQYPTRPQMMQTGASTGVNQLQNPVQGYGNQPRPAGDSGGLGINLARAAMEGFVEGAFQQVGQTIVQEVMTSGSGGDGGGGDSSTY